MKKSVQRAEQILKKSVQRTEQMEHKEGEHHMGLFLSDVRLQRFLFLLFHSTFSRHGKAQASLALLIWLNENVPFHGTFSRHGKAQASLAQPICLNEKVPLTSSLF